MTPYRTATDRFTQSDNFRELVRLSRQPGEDERYARNRLMTAFEAGWNSKTSTILTALEEILRKQEEGEKK